LILGLDPGLNGALAWVSERGVEQIADMPTFELTRNGKTKRSIDIAALLRLIRARPAWPSDNSRLHAFVEDVGPMPSQGVSSVFAFGKVCGIIQCALHALDIPFTLVSPVKWKKALSVPAAKDGARARASQLLPGGSEYWPRVKDDGRAEAALIAYYGLTQTTIG
jgi:crossover junction endodeoxyribonuclease RuvC